MIDFSFLARSCARLATLSSRTIIIHEIAQLYDKATPEQAQITSYLVLGTLRPDYQATQFLFATKRVAQLLADIAQQPFAQFKKALEEIGDLALLVDVSWWPGPEQSHHSLEEIYRQLVHLESLEGEGVTELKAEQLGALLKSVDAPSAALIIRIVTGSLRLGFSDMTLIAALAQLAGGGRQIKQAVEDGYNRCADIGLVAATMRASGLEGVQRLAIQVGIPVRPAAAERLNSPQEILQKIGPCVVQPKLDGFRVQVHIKKESQGQKVWFYSRNLRDISAMMPDIVAALACVDADSAIMEGEALSYDEETGAFLPFQQTATRRRKHGIEQAASENPLRLFVFDLLYCNGDSLIEQPHAQRRAHLQKLLAACNEQTAVQLIDEWPTPNAEKLQECFDHAVELGVEGLIAKRPDAPYQPGKRNFNWIKLKRSYHGHLQDSIDTVILGYYLGRGRRAALGIGALLLGVYDKAHDRFQTIAKLGTGLNDVQWREIKKRCDASAAVEKPHNVQCASQLIPHVWVDPTIVCVVQADEITLSPLHTAGSTAAHEGYALRFPRFYAYREDKRPEDITTVAEIKQLYTLQRPVSPSSESDN
jgi:DNA ligase-1